MIESILNQTYKNIELIIIDDGSIDNSSRIIQSYTDFRIKFYKNDGNKGLVYTLNRAIALASGEYIARMDADDISLSKRIEKQIDYIKKYNLDLIGCMTERIDMDGNSVIPIANKSYSPTTITKCIKYDNCIAHPTWLGRKKIFEELGGYRNFHACEDYDFLLRAYRHNYKLGICDSIQLKYRENLNGVSFSNLFKQRVTTKYLQDNINNIDNITEVDLNKKLMHTITISKENKYINGLKLFDEGIASLRHNNIIGVIGILKGAFLSRYVCSRFVNLVIIQVIRSIYKFLLFNKNFYKLKKNNKYYWFIFK